VTEAVLHIRVFWIMTLYIYIYIDTYINTYQGNSPTLDMQATRSHCYVRIKESWKPITLVSQPPFG